MTGGSILCSFVTHFIQSLTIRALANIVAAGGALAGIGASIRTHRVAIITLLCAFCDTVATHCTRRTRTG